MLGLKQRILQTNESIPQKRKEEELMNVADTIPYEEQLKALEVVRRRQEIDLKGIFGYWVLGIVSVWVLFTMVIIGYYAFFTHINGLSDKVLCVLLGTTVVVSLATTVLKGLFGRKK